MDKFIKGAIPYIPHMIYTLIGLAVITLVVSIVKILLKKRAERLRDLARQNNFLFERLLTPNELDDRDPVITQQQATGPILRGGRRPKSPNDGGMGVDLSSFNSQVMDSELLPQHPPRPLPTGLDMANPSQSVEKEPMRAEYIGGGRHQSINAAAVNQEALIAEPLFQPLPHQVPLEQALNNERPISNKDLLDTYQVLNSQLDAEPQINSEEVNIPVTAEDTGYDKAPAMSQSEYRLFERLLDRLETFHNGQGFMLLNSVPMGRFIRSNDGKVIQSLNNRLVDFVIVNEHRKAIVVIQSKDKQPEDNAAIQDICAKAGIAYFEFADNYDTSEMNQISKILNLSEHLEKSVA